MIVYLVEPALESARLEQSLRAMESMLSTLIPALIAAPAKQHARPELSLRHNRVELIRVNRRRCVLRIGVLLSYVI